MSDHTDQRVLLNKYLNDPKKKLLESEERNGGQSYLFRSSVTDLPDEIRYNDVWFFDNGQTVRMSRQTEVRQKRDPPGRAEGTVRANKSCIKGKEK